MQKRESKRSPSGKWIAEVRPTPGRMVETGAGEAEATEMWLIEARTKKSRLLLRGRNSSDVKKVLAEFSSLSFSLDERYLYFNSAALATEGSIHRVDLKTGGVKFLLFGAGVDVILRGRERGNLLVLRSIIKGDQGRNVYAWVASPEGKLLREIGEADGKAAATYIKNYVNA